MPKIAYIDRDFRADARSIIFRANAIIKEYAAEGHGLTLRQLYYQFVTRNFIENKDSEYKRLGSVINDARLAGLVDWHAITDRTRNLRSIGHWDNPGDVITSAAQSYATDKWASQPYRVEVWIEKDALVGVLAEVCPRLDVPYFSCRGYTSQSEVWSAAQRIGGHIANKQPVRIIHLGDHDPSGIDMTRDISDRLSMFIAQDQFGALPGDTAEEFADVLWNEELSEQWFEVDRIALNMPQIREHNPPPNPAKLTDARAAGYIQKFGRSSWELDALSPRILVGLIEDAVLALRDEDEWNAATAKESSERRVLTAASKHWPAVAAELESKGLVEAALPDADDYLDDPED